MSEEFSNVPPQALQSREEFTKFFNELDEEITNLETLAAPTTNGNSAAKSPSEEKLEAQKTSEKAVAAQSEKLYGVFKHKAHIGVENGVLVFQNLPPEFEKEAASLVNRVETLQRKGSLNLPSGIFTKKTSVTSEVLAEMKSKDGAKSTSPPGSSSTSPGSTSPPQQTWLNPTKADEEKMRLQRLININKAMMDFEYEETLASMDTNIGGSNM
eukprot:TRINITY_DN1369_c0_g1_i1.p1 TRINITY_DN1369_c0_g1~~TRINITY_DN1369_c0_g1_i1.p1  ORF type:complete len:213 (+),score=72.34 TRINITY_DN1369_c0_g1_i1:207-845(+)